MSTPITGTTLGMSATLPTTYDAEAITGYPSLTMTAVGKIIDAGELAKAFNVIATNYVGQAYPEKDKDTYDVGNLTLTLGRLSSDAGQVLLQTALASSASYAFQITLPSGDYGAVTGKVIKAGIGGVASGNIETTVVEIAVDANTLFEA
ncbi:MAG: hypothetical protein KAT90_15405 [Gammaproteobacteria bacterium]|nr:hypothetical protein [Gammaproteobacteria bacterium]